MNNALIKFLIAELFILLCIAMFAIGYDQILLKENANYKIFTCGTEQLFLQTATEKYKQCRSFKESMHTRSFFMLGHIAQAIPIDSENIKSKTQLFDNWAQIYWMTLGHLLKYYDEQGDKNCSDALVALGVFQSSSVAARQINDDNRFFKLAEKSLKDRIERMQNELNRTAIDNIRKIAPNSKE